MTFTLRRGRNDATGPGGEAGERHGWWCWEMAGGAAGATVGGAAGGIVGWGVGMIGGGLIGLAAGVFLGLAIARSNQTHEHR